MESLHKSKFVRIATILVRRTKVDEDFAISPATVQVEFCHYSEI